MKTLSSQSVPKPKVNSSNELFEEESTPSGIAVNHPQNHQIIKEHSRLGVHFSGLGFKHSHHRGIKNVYRRSRAFGVLLFVKRLVQLMTSEKVLPLIANDLSTYTENISQKKRRIRSQSCLVRNGNRVVNLPHSAASPLGAVHSERVDSEMEQSDRVADRFGLESGLIPSGTQKLLTTHKKRITPDSLVHLPILTEKYPHEKNEGSTTSSVFAPAEIEKVSGREGLEPERKSIIAVAPVETRTYTCEKDAFI